MCSLCLDRVLQGLKSQLRYTEERVTRLNDDGNRLVTDLCLESENIDRIQDDMKECNNKWRDLDDDAKDHEKK